MTRDRDCWGRFLPGHGGFGGGRPTGSKNSRTKIFEALGWKSNGRRLVPPALRVEHSVQLTVADALLRIEALERNMIGAHARLEALSRLLADALYEKLSLEQAGEQLRAVRVEIVGEPPSSSGA
jgi:hypothetical protein